MAATELPSSEISVDLPETLDFAACEELADTLGETPGAALTLEAGSVRFLGALAAEILLRARADCLADGAAFSLVNPSDELVRGLALLGIPTHELIQEDSE